MKLQDIKPLLTDPRFLIILLIKIVAGTLLASDFFVKGFAPFVNYYVTSQFSDPYNFFLALDYSRAFPYPTVMLWILAIPRLIFAPVVSGDWTVVQFMHLFILHLPLVLADVVIYLVLCAWLETKERLVLWLYWASPILFYITYIHGQLDVIPMALLFLSLFYLFRQRFLVALIVLGVALATKTHLLVVLPFYFIYVVLNHTTWKKVLAVLVIPVGLLIVFILPYLTSTGFLTSVFATEEGAKSFLVHLPYLYNDLKFLLAPAAIFILFFNFYSYQKLSRDGLLLILGLVFTVFIIFVPPMPGWFYWSLPFFIYFMAKYKEIPKISFWALHLAYFGYMLTSPDSSVFSSLQLIFPPAAAWPSLYNVGLAAGVNMNIIVNLLFTLLVAAAGMTALWVYRVGVRSNLEYKVTHKPLVIGIGGDSGSGKNMLAQLLNQLFHSAQTQIIEGDDAHKWERHDSHWQALTHLNPKSNKLHSELVQTTHLKQGETIQRESYDHHTGKFTQPNNVTPRQVMIYVGLHPFYLSKMRSMFDLKIYLEPDEQLRAYWKIKRDQQERGRSKAEVLQQMAQRSADAQKYIYPQREFADIIMRLSVKGELHDDQEPNLILNMTCDNSLHVDPLLEALAAYDTLSVDHWYDDDLKHQTIVFDGTITAADIQNTAYSLIPNLEELTYQAPTWQADYDGLRQLFILYYYSEQKKSS